MKCKKCGTEFEGKFCPECGAAAEQTSTMSPSSSLKLKQNGYQQPATPNGKASKKPPFFLKWWFIVLIVIAVIAIFFLLSGGESKGEKIKWADMKLGNMLPEPPSNKGTIYDNSDEELWLSLEKVSDKQYSDYYDACVEKGFDIDGDETSFSYKAYNSEGYCLDISHTRDDLSIHLIVPRAFSNIKWPTGTAGKMLPAPKSTIGEFSFEHDDGFYVEMGNTSREDYDEYVDACSEKGFTVGYNKGDDYYYADNAEGWHLSLKYEGNNIMSIRIDAPDPEPESTELKTTESESMESENAEVKSTEPETAEPESMESENTEVKNTEPEATEPENTSLEESEEDGLSSDFKEAMDSYETFIDEYVAFMKKYQENPTNLELLANYADYMSKYAEFMNDFEKWEDAELNAAETAYYIEVQSRVSKKLLEVAAEMESAEEESTEKERTESETTEPESTTLEESKGDELSSDFKEAMDSYEAFMDEYIAFMKKYEENPTDIELITSYVDYMGKYTEFMNDFAKWNDSEMNAAEAAYYIEVQTRVNKKLLEISQ